MLIYKHSLQFLDIGLDQTAVGPENYLEMLFVFIIHSSSLVGHLISLSATRGLAHCDLHRRYFCRDVMRSFPAVQRRPTGPRPQSASCTPPERRSSWTARRTARPPPRSAGPKTGSPCPVGAQARQTGSDAPQRSAPRLC